MKEHKYGAEIPCFGDAYKECVSCGAILLNGDMGPYSDIENWLLISKDCDLAGKQVEIFNRQQELEESRKFYLCW
jgi:hypothetical protein